MSTEDAMALMVLIVVALAGVVYAAQCHRKKRDVLAHVRDGVFPAARPHRARHRALHVGPHGGAYLLMLAAPAFIAALLFIVWFAYEFVSTIVDLADIMPWT
jgi:hypothetical protein